MAKRVLIIATIVTMLVSGGVFAGAVLDDVLNYMFLDQTTPVHPRYEWFKAENAISLVKGKPIGQTFVTGPETVKIIRIRGSIHPDADWQKGEGAEMVLWDSPAKTVALGRYTIWYEFRGFQFAQPEWEVKAEVKPNTQYYFEISYVGEGDGKLSAVGVMNGKASYEQGQGYLEGKEADFDVCFATHVKRPMDRVGNLKKAFTRFNLDMPELAGVKSAVQKEDFDTAQKDLVSYFEGRKKPVPVLESVKPFPGFDIKEADLALENFMSAEGGKGYAGPDINWRGEPDFNPDGTVAASGWNTGMNRFGPRGPLTKGYLATGDDKYVKKLNDVLIDWYLDNPPPGISHIGGDSTDPVWATLDAGARLAANFAAYKRIANSPAFTLDCRMAYLLNLADEADTLVLNGAKDGGNWSFTQNVAMFEFAVNFPEYTNWPKWRDTAEERLAITIDRDICPDGVENEAAPGYQRMSYGPLVSLYNLMRERGVQTTFSGKLKDVIAKQAEYFMYMSMPNGKTPYLGDWGNTEEREALKGDSNVLGRADMLYAATAGKEGVRPKELSKLYPYFGVLTMRSDWGGAGRLYEDARYMMLHAVRCGSHGHSDLNEITCYAYGRELLSDPGAYTYGSPEHDYMCTSPAHNLMTIDGESHAWRPKARWNRWSPTPAADYISSRVSGYKGGEHNREILYVKANGDAKARDYWVVRDTTEGSGIHSIEQRWHLTPGPAKLQKDTLIAASMFDAGGNLSIIQLDPSRLTCEEATTKTWPRDRGTQDYKSMPTFIYKTQASLPAAIDTVLFPYKGKQLQGVTVKALEKSADGLASSFKVVQGDVQDIFMMQKSPAKKWLASEKIGFDGERLFVRKVRGQVRSVLLVNGSSLTMGGKRIIASTTPVPWISVSLDSSGAKVYTGTAGVSVDIPIARGRKVTVINTGSDDIIDAANPK